MKIWYLVYIISRFIDKVRAHIVHTKPNVWIGKNTIIEHDVAIKTLGGGSIIIGNNCWISQGVKLITWGGKIEIGDNTSINPYTIVYGQGGTIIGSGVRIAAHCVIVPSNHIFDNKDIYIYKQGLSMNGIIIEDNVWLGAGVKVLDGVKIAFGSVVGANAVVTKSTDINGVYVGIPAKKIKDR